METIAANAQAAQGAVKTLLQFIGEDITRDGLLDTPSRVVKAWQEMTAGYSQNPEEILGRVFEQEYDEMIILKKIQFYSTCEHHLLPFYGEASVGYLPGKVVGISKLARLVECFAKRLQIQERLTQQIASAVLKHLDAKGVGVSIQAHHLCMGCRGVKQQSSQMVTNIMLGQLRNDDKARNEFLLAIRG